MSNTETKQNEKFFAHLSDTWGHKWGYRDSRFVLNRDGSVRMEGNRYELCGRNMPDFISYVEEVLNVAIDAGDVLPEIENKRIASPNFNEVFLRDIETAFEKDRYSAAADDRLIHSHGQTTTEEVYKVLYGEILRTVDLVFYPESEQEVVTLIKLAEKSGVCLVPYGGGTSVSCALKIPESETRMVVSVDTRRMNKVEWMDRRNRRICVQAGITGSALEEIAVSNGFTVGHEPDSVELSTLGGWIATNASGMKKNRYGNIEDMVENVTMISPSGTIEQMKPITRASIGVNPCDFMFGSEGNFGLITKAVLKLHKLPEVKEYDSVVFPDWESGVNFLYELSQTSFIPASVRLVDNFQFRFGQALKPRSTGLDKFVGKLKKMMLTKIKGFDLSKLCAATLVMEGTKTEAEYKRRNISKLAKGHGGLMGGSENGKKGYLLTYAIAYIRDFMNDYHVIGETLETSVPWSLIHQVCRAAERRLAALHEENNLPGLPYLSYRIPQIYHTGVCIYFMVGMSMKGVRRAEEVFGTIEYEMRKTIMESGGSISHHHGVGKLRKDFMTDTLSKDSIALLREIKTAHDKHNIFGIKNNIFADQYGPAN